MDARGYAGDYARGDTKEENNNNFEKHFLFLREMINKDCLGGENRLGCV